ncbi:MAG: hypothetical protein F4124_13095 [Acidimicrobiia bacterium]|nr:hypothetical protein [Acidimicrobiia bacterium]MXZ84465.1 hypothetical protein [Acidimicrobiia bacterium]MYB11528.1 hypothetical protein [Acidimicrobiia bacterium]MYB74174.1 hypothetical protein [Acidimicrobiia bacterium]MYG59688.1 hypothetical protein [Acidimicrobiia bacterium]
MELQRKAQKVWKETLFAQLLRQVADSHERCAWLMHSVLPDESIVGDWENMARYLGTVAAAIGEDPDCAKQEMPASPLRVGYIPEVIRYEKLAELVRPNAVEELLVAAVAVARFCRFNLTIAPNEMQLACLQGLANGETLANLAKRLGYSERHVQRILAEMWHQFGVASTTEGVAFAVAQGWVTAHRDIASRSCPA